MLANQNTIELPVDIFRLIRDMVHEYCGIYFDDQSKYFLEGRLQNSLRRLQLDNFRDYYLYLKYDPRGAQEFNHLVDVLTIHETYFFREEHQLKALTDEILPELHSRRAASRTLRIWSAGCSTGEEAYTVSMLLLEQESFRDWQFEIFASDVSQRVLQFARRGVYGASALRAISPYFLTKYFHKEEQGMRIDDRVKENVTFMHLNLLDSERLVLVSALDVILCRNVIIYFDHETKKKVVETFHQKLNPGGYLLLGHSESLINLSTAFRLRHLKNDIVYQRPGVDPCTEPQHCGL